MRDVRKLVALTFSDFDPSGYQMPVSIGVKLMAQQVLQFPTFEFVVQPVALTLEDVVRLRLPTSMVEKNDKRIDMWQDAHAGALIEAGLLTRRRSTAAGPAPASLRSHHLLTEPFPYTSVVACQQNTGGALCESLHSLLPSRLSLPFLRRRSRRLSRLAGCRAAGNRETAFSLLQ